VIENRLLTENLDLKLGLKKAIRKLALQKALASKADYRGLILAVDTVVVLGDKILGKPQDLTDAKKSLRQLSDKTHLVISGFALVDTVNNKTVCRTETSQVTFRLLTEAEIDFYCNNYQVLDKAGAYAIQEYAQNFVSKVTGSVENITGLPIKTLLKTLQA
jgi:septum formation protein